MLRLYILALLVVPTLAIGQQDETSESKRSLRGDAVAVERVMKMLDQMGGADMWARSKQLHIVQHGWFTGPSEAAIETFWRSLEYPAQFESIVGHYTNTIHVVTDKAAWTDRKGVISEMSPEAFAERKANWFNGSYTMIYRLATGDQKLFLKFEEPHRVRILDENGDEISWYEINEFGHWMKWGRSTSSGASPEYVYGPMRDFGNLRFPAWGAATDASWRYSYQTVELSFAPIDQRLLQRAGSSIR